MRALPHEVEARRATLFWDVDWTQLDPEKHEDFILGRVLVEGDWECVRAIRRQVGDEALAAFLRRAGGRRLDRRTRRFDDAEREPEPDLLRPASWTSVRDFFRAEVKRIWQTP
jgi:hypothetical protein